MAKSKKQATCEDYVKKLTAARDTVVGILDAIRVDSKNFGKGDNLGHLMAHQDNITGEFDVIIGQLQGFVVREKAIADAEAKKAEEEDT